MRRIRLIMSYSETAYFGFRMQPEAVTAEQKPAETVQGLARASAQFVLAGRTDTGVYALGNATVFDTEFPMPAERSATALNTYLPPDIRIQAADEVTLNWHPRKQHCEKTYEYHIWGERVVNPLLRNSTTHCYVSLNPATMCAALPSLLGGHDFVAFYASGSTASHTVRHIFRVELATEYEKSGNFAGFVTFRITGSGFPYHMVWILAGTLLGIRNGKKDTAAFRKALRNRAHHGASPVTSAAGLVLWEIHYLPIPDRYVADNEDWRYELSQGDLASTEVSRLTAEHCRPDNYVGLMTRLLHESHRDGTYCILLRDLENSTRLVVGQHYGSYEIRENTNPGNRNSFPYLTTEAESGTT